jgi:hypothetical protein
MRMRTALLVALALGALASAPASAGAKKYYLTVDTFLANQALDACGKGYHMATLWEIRNVTLLKYDTKRGQTAADSGSGPPAGSGGGWIRTGGGASTVSNPGVGNCNAWTATDGMEYGTIVELRNSWGDPGLSASPWSPAAANCDSVLPVWCKQN